MPFCSKCGADVSGVRFCSKCGAPVEPAGGPIGGGGSSSSADSGLSDNMAGALAYLFLPAILFLVIDPFKGRRFVRFHSFQAIFYTLATWVVWIAINTVATLLSVVAGLGFLVWMLSPLVTLATMIIWVILVVKAYQGQEFKLPLIGDLAAKQA
jgi:uncharacterized membrane protein